MSDYICYLLIVLYESQKKILKVGLKIKRDKLTQDQLENYMEPENMENLWSILPLHVRSCGPVVDVEEIFEIESAIQRKGEMKDWICPNCGKVESAYWGQCLKCGSILNPVVNPKEMK